MNPNTDLAIATLTAERDYAKKFWLEAERELAFLRTKLHELECKIEDAEVLRSGSAQHPTAEQYQAAHKALVAESVTMTVHGHKIRVINSEDCNAIERALEDDRRLRSSAAPLHVQANMNQAAFMFVAKHATRMQLGDQSVVANDLETLLIAVDQQARRSVPNKSEADRVIDAWKKRAECWRNVATAFREASCPDAEDDALMVAQDAFNHAVAAWGHPNYPEIVGYPPQAAPCASTACTGHLVHDEFTHCPEHDR